TRSDRDWSSDVCSSDLGGLLLVLALLIATFGVGLTHTTGLPAAAAASGSAKCPWMNPKLSPDVRARMVVKHMTLAQKVSLLYGRSEERRVGKEGGCGVA